MNDRPFELYVLVKRWILPRDVGSDVERKFGAGKGVAEKDFIRNTFG